MTPLQALILVTLKAHGQLNDLELWTNVSDQETGGMSSTIVIACFELQTAGYIEPSSNDPHSWQLSNAGLEFVAAHLNKEVCLGSN